MINTYSLRYPGVHADVSVRRTVAPTKASIESEKNLVLNIDALAGLENRNSTANTIV